MDYEILKALLCLFHKEWYFNRIIDAEISKELFANKQLNSAENYKKSQYRQELEKNTIQRMKLLKYNMSRSFVLLLFATVIGFHFFLFKNKYVINNISFNNLLGWGSIFLFSWATLSRLGWQGQSYKGNTIFERLDEYIFRSLYFIGMLLGTLSLLL